jgi:hypothetical protein
MRWPFAAVTLLALPTCGCGRVGYDPLPAGGRSGEAGAGDSGGGGGTGGRDASTTEPPASGGTNGTGGVPTGGSGGGAGSAGVRGGGPRDAAPDVAGPSCAITGQPIADYCMNLPELVLPATIDGELDCGLALHSLTPAGWTGGAALPDATAEYAVAWRFDGLYFYVFVHDPLVVPATPASNIWEGDGIEIFVDSNGAYTASSFYDATGTRQFTTAAPNAGTASVARGQIWAFPLPLNGGLPADWLSTTYRTFPKPGGYALEAFVVGADLGLASWSLSAGANVGMDVGINVSYPEADASGAFGHRLGQYFVSVDPNPPDGGVASPFVNTRAFCNPTLVGR